MPVCIITLNLVLLCLRKAPERGWPCTIRRFSAKVLLYEIAEPDQMGWKLEARTGAGRNPRLHESEKGGGLKSEAKSVVSQPTWCVISVRFLRRKLRVRRNLGLGFTGVPTETHGVHCFVLACELPYCWSYFLRWAQGNENRGPNLAAL